MQSPAVQGQAHSQISIHPVQSDLLKPPRKASRACSVGLHCQPVNGHLFIEKTGFVCQPGVQVSLLGYKSWEIEDRRSVVSGLGRSSSSWLGFYK